MPQRPSRLQKWMSKYHIGDALMFLLFVAIAVVFWVLQNLKTEYELPVDVPLTLVGVPEDVTITGELPSSVRATVHGPGTSLIRFYGGELNPIQVDFARYDRELEAGNVRIPATDIRAAIDSQIGEGANIVALDCDTLEVYYNRGVSRRLPVRLTGTITPAAHGYLQSVRLQPDTIEVVAPREMLDTMQCVYTRPVQLNEVSESHTVEAGFAMRKGVVYRPSTVSVRVNIDYYTDRRIDVPITIEGLPQGKSLYVSPSTVTVSYRIGAQLDRLTAADFPLVITYDDVRDRTDGICPLQLKVLPPNVSDVQIQPSEVEFLIKTEGRREGGRR